jgi:predicted metal-binding protein
LNSTFGKRLPEVTDISTFVELQREYGSTLWENTKEATQNQTEIMKSALTEAGEAVRKVFNTDAA